jgi:hydrogenase maturation factor
VPVQKYDGAILAARHSFMPNRLGYCGPDENEVLFEACLSNKRSKELLSALEGFTGAQPYLKFIAQSQGLEPFDYRVVEAYWIGNDILERIPRTGFYDHLRERLARKFPREHIRKLFESKPFATFPHHALHVFNAFSTMGTVPDAFANAVGRDDQVGDLMDKCRISWGKVLSLDNDGNLIVEYEPLQRRDGILSLGQAVQARVISRINDNCFMPDVKMGDWVSFHWGFACSILSAQQVANLRKYTHMDMAVANTVPVPQ